MGMTPLEGLMMGTRCGEGARVLGARLLAVLRRPPAFVASARLLSRAFPFATLFLCTYLKLRAPARLASHTLPACAGLLSHPLPTPSLTPSGDIDPAITTYLSSRGMSAKDIDTLMNKKSGFLGLAGGG